jgi:adenylate cyclase
MGDTVNTASRLEGANKPYGTRVMLSDTAAEACGKEVLLRTLDFLKVKGKTEATKVHELIGLDAEPGALYPAKYIVIFEEAMKFYREGQFDQALALFESCLRGEPKDTVAKLYASRCAEFIKHPPEGPWDGVYVMKTK